METREEGVDSENPPQQEASKGTTFARMCYNALNTLLGMGILATPFALSQGGWMSLIMFLMVAFICCYTALLLQRCLEVDSRVETYPDIAHAALGPKGRVTVSVCLYLELYMVAVGLLILEGDNLAKLFPRGFGGLLGMNIKVRGGFIVLAAIVVMPTTWLKSLSILAYVSVAGVFATATLVASILWVGTFGGVGFHEKGRLLNYKDLPTSLSLFIFSYAGHAVIPTLYTSMKDKRQYSKVIVVSFLSSTIGYGLMAVLGYLMYGNMLKSQVTLNLPNNNIGSKIAIYITLIGPIAKYALVINPISTAIEEMLRRWQPRYDKRLVSMFIRTMIVVSTALVALAVPLFGYVMALTGASLNAILSFLLPCICYMKLKGHRLNKTEMMVLVVILGAGVGAGVIGTYSSICNIIKNL